MEAPDGHTPLLDAAGELRQVPEGSCLRSGQVCPPLAGGPLTGPGFSHTCVSTALRPPSR